LHPQRRVRISKAGIIKGKRIPVLFFMDGRIEVDVESFRTGICRIKLPLKGPGFPGFTPPDAVA